MDGGMEPVGKHTKTIGQVSIESLAGSEQKVAPQHDEKYPPYHAIALA
jgi:hypothetical protein